MPAFEELLIVMVVVWTAGKLFRSLGLPVVFGELMGGILVGPAVLGLVHPGTEVITVIAELGIFFLMLHAGLETDHRELLNSGKKSISIAIGSFFLPLLCGYAVARMFGQSETSAMFIGIAVSVTAVAVAARVFKDCKILQHRVAHISLGAAVIEEILAFVAFSVVLSIAQTGRVDLLLILWLIVKVAAFFFVVLWLGVKTAPYFNRVFYLGNKGFTLTLIVALCLGLIAEAIGLHMIIGAFLAGLFMQEEVIDEKTFNKIEDRVYGLSYSFFGPIFFASLAFHFELTALITAPLFFAAIFVVAVLGKVIGSSVVALLLGLKKTEAAVIGLAMNNRGAVELIIASIGFQKGIIDETVFSILVLMAFSTTILSILLTPRYAKQIT